MNLNKLLQHKINKNIPIDILDNPFFKPFIKVVNDS
jgi:hypothetical protein